MNAIQIVGDDQPVQPHIFWGEMAACEHLVQIYQEDGAFLDALEGFAAGGLATGEAVVVIATAEHLAALENRLQNHGHCLATAGANDQYIALDAKKSLSQFVVDGWPIESLFEEFVVSLLARARGNGRRVRAFGEMVAVLWAQGHNGATIRLEHLWHEVCAREAFSLFCAYPRSGFTQDAEVSIKEICAAHSRVIAC